MKKESKKLENILGENLLSMIKDASEYKVPYEFISKGMPSGCNYISGKKYEGYNQIITSRRFLRPLFVNGKAVPRSNYWITLKQAEGLGATLKDEFKNYKKIKSLREKINELISSLRGKSDEERERINDEIDSLRSELSNLEVSIQILFNTPFEKKITQMVDGVEVPVMVPDTSKEPDKDGNYPLKQKTETFWCQKYTTLYPVEVFDNLPNIEDRLTPKDYSNSHENLNQLIMNLAYDYCDEEEISLSFEEVPSPKYIVTDDEEVLVLLENKQFKNVYEYYNMMFEMLAKTTKKEGRCNRKDIDEKSKSKEELIATITSLSLLIQMEADDETTFNNNLAKLKTIVESEKLTDVDVYFATLKAAKASSYILKYLKNNVVKNNNNEFWNDELDEWVELDIATRYTASEAKKLSIEGGNVVQL